MLSGHSLLFQSWLINVKVIKYDSDSRGKSEISVRSEAFRSDALKQHQRLDVDVRRCLCSCPRAQNVTVVLVCFPCPHFRGTVCQQQKDHFLH